MTEPLELETTTMLAEQPRHATPVVQAGPESIMAIISRAATDPATDMDKLERLLGMYERITAHDAEAVYNQAMTAAQAEMRPISADASNPSTKSKYASFAALDRVLRPIYTSHGFSLSFDTADGAPPEHVRLVCKVANGAHAEHPRIDMPADGKGAKGGDVMTKTHAMGAAVSYGRRYLLAMIFNIAVGEDDERSGDGGSGRNQTAAVTAATEAINACNTRTDLAVWKKNNADHISGLPPADQTAIIRLYNTRADKMKEAAQ